MKESASVDPKLFSHISRKQKHRRKTIKDKSILALNQCQLNIVMNQFKNRAISALKLNKTFLEFFQDNKDNFEEDLL